MALCLREGTRREYNDNSTSHGHRKVPDLQYPAPTGDYKDATHPKTIDWPKHNQYFVDRRNVYRLGVVYHGNDKTYYSQRMQDMYFSGMPYVSALHKWIQNNATQCADDQLLLTEIESLKIGTKIDENIVQGCFVSFECDNVQHYGILSKYEPIEAEKLHEFEILNTFNCELTPIDINDETQKELVMPHGMSKMDSNQLCFEYVIDYDNSESYYCNFTRLLLHLLKIKIEEKEQELAVEFHFVF